MLGLLRRYGTTGLRWQTEIQQLNIIIIDTGPQLPEKLRLPLSMERWRSPGGFPAIGSVQNQR